MRELDVIAYEGRLRVEHNIDDPESGLVLRDSSLAPLTAEELRAAQGKGA